MSDSAQGVSPKYDDVDPQVLEAVIDAFYPRAVALGDSARNRAQAAYALLSALIGSALSVAVIASDQASGRMPMIAVLVSAALWFAAALTYLSAIAGPVDLEASPYSHRPTQPSPQAEFVWEVLDKAKVETRTIRRRQRRATVVAVVALFMTLLSIAFLALWRNPTREAVVYYDASVEGPIRQECGTSDSLFGEVVLSSTSGDDLVLRVDPPTCGSSPRLLKIPSDAVQIVVFRED